MGPDQTTVGLNTAFAGSLLLPFWTPSLAPQPVRLNPSDPFYSIAPVRPSGFTIMQGKPYVSRYRVVVSDGAADKALLDRLWNDYASPPEAKLEP
jgi:hypothetical protein